MTTNVNSRALALEMLIEINEEGQYSHLVLREVLEKYQYLDKKERAFLTRMVEGTLEKQITIDDIINQFSKTKIKKMKPVIRNLLRMSTYQILYMDKVPDSAVCNEAVKLAKKRGLSGLSGFVNGVLRSIARNRNKWKLPDEKKEPVRAVSIYYSIPEWMIETWIKTYGMEKTKEIAEGFSSEAPFTIRVNLNHLTPDELRNKLEAEGITVIPVEGITYAFAVSGIDYLNRLESFQNGDFYVQDISSMRVAQLAGVKKGDYVIDVCAAPGGKSTHLAEMLDGTGMVEARDLTEYKIGLIEENIKKHGLKNIRAVQKDATVLDESSIERADVLICDLPCSGLGVLGKKTDIRYKMTKEKALELAKLQRQILKTVNRYVKPGGTLIYSTCTIHEEENEKNVAWFLEQFRQFKLVTQEQLFPGKQSRDGFFLAKLVRRKDE